MPGGQPASGVAGRCDVRCDALHAPGPHNAQKDAAMLYRRLGSAGIKVSVLSLGSWVTYGSQVDVDSATPMIKYAYDHGINSSTTPKSTRAASPKPSWARPSAKTRFQARLIPRLNQALLGHQQGRNEKNTLNRKYLLEGIEGSLDRLGYEVCRPPLLPPPRPRHSDRRDRVGHARHRLRRQGAVLGHEQWSAEQIRRHGRSPTGRQSQETADGASRSTACSSAQGRKGISRASTAAPVSDSTTFSPLARALSGKYRDGNPQGLALCAPGYDWLQGAMVPR